MTKATMLISVGLAAGLALADGMSMADARKQVADCVSNPSTMTAVVKQLSAADQLVYLGDVVAAVSKMPGSKEETAAAYVNVSRAALKGAAKDNIAKMIAEIFATIPPEYLPVVSESLASDMVNRAADASKVYTDSEYVSIASNVMVTVNERLMATGSADSAGSAGATGAADSADVRSAFAALTFIRGSNNASDSIVSAMVATLPESARKPAAEEWFPAALADGDNKNYDAMLVAASADDAVSPDALSSMLMNVPAPQAGVALLADLAGANTDPTTDASQRTPSVDAMHNAMSEVIPPIGSGSPVDTFLEGVVQAHEDASANPRPEPLPPYQTQNTGMN